MIDYRVQIVDGAHATTGELGEIHVGDGEIDEGAQARPKALTREALEI